MASRGDRSIQEFGTQAGGAQAGEVSTAAHSFFAAMAASDYPGVCESLLASNRKQLQAFLKAARHPSCPGAVKRLILPAAVTQARMAATAAVSAVRVKGDTAFVLFHPQGGPASYIAMKREGGAWRAIGLAPGAPLNRAAGAP